MDAAHLVWGVSLGNIDWNPHPVRRSDLDHPDELRVDIDPTPGAPWDAVRRVALLAHDVLVRARAARVPAHVRLARDAHPRAHPSAVGLPDRARAALALAREVERRGARPGDLEVVEGGAPARGRCSSTTTRTPRTTRWRAPTASGRSPTPASPARSTGTRWPTASRASSRIRHRAGAAGRARRPVGRHRRPSRLARRPARAGAGGRGARPRRRAVAAALRQAAGRAEARAALAREPD